MVVSGRGNIEAALATPPRYGIVAAAPVVNDAPREWVNGFAFLPEACGDSGADCIDCGSLDQAISVSSTPRVVEGDPFVVYATDSCSSIGFRAHDYEGRARRQLEATQSYEIAKEFWTGTLRDSCGLDNWALVDIGSDRLTKAGTPVTPLEALGLLESGLGDCSEGRQGMIHVTPQVLTHLAAAYAITRVGNLWETAMGNIVVADAGYPGWGPLGDLGPAGATQFAYATSMIYLHLGPVEVLGGVPTATDTSGLDRSVNTITTLAFRPVAIQWDHCCFLTAEVNLALPLIGGAS